MSPEKTRNVLKHHSDVLISMSDKKKLVKEQILWISHILHLKYFQTAAPNTSNKHNGSEKADTENSYAPNTRIWFWNN